MIDNHLGRRIVCPHCHATLTEGDNKLKCAECNRIYPIKCNIPDFRDKDDYWCNVSRAKMQHLNRRSEETGDWLKSAREVIPQYSDHFIHFYRADSQFLWPTNSDSRILDAGSMWGGVTIPAAQFHREVYAVDKTLETLEFLKIRSEQMGFNNICTCAAPLKSLPFSDNFFDLVVLNGVLEWVGLEEDTVLEQHWKGKRSEKQSYAKTAKEMQIDVLRELRRVIKPEGSLYIAIENRYGIQYFLGYPDDHNNVRFVPFLPRILANKISKILGKGEYRTYVYSPGQLVNLLEKSGFKINSMYGVFPHYIKIKKAFPLNMAWLFKNEVQIDGIIPRVLNEIVKPFIPKSIAQHVSPSLFAICRKSNNKNHLIPRIHSLLIKADILKANDRIRFIISNNRFENYNSTNIIVYNQNNSPLYFCKLARDPKISGVETEAENLKWLSNKMLGSKALSFEIPEVIYCGVLDGIEIFVTTFLDAKNIKLSPHYIINRGLDKIGVTNGFVRNSIGFAEEKLFLKRIDGKIRKAIRTLVEFQRVALNGKSNIRDVGNNIIDEYFRRQEKVPDEIRRNVLQLRDRIKIMPVLEISTCSIHGDYDFDNVIFFNGGKVGLVDFEHLEKSGFPFFDLGTLIFNPLIIKWTSSYLKNESFGEYLNHYGVIEYIRNWLKFYCDRQHLPYSIIPIIPKLVAVEQNSKTYPSFRDPDTYPMYGESALKELLFVNIDEK